MVTTSRLAVAAAILVAHAAFSTAAAAESQRFSEFCGFRLWPTTLLEVARVFGSAKLIRSGDAATSHTTLCYAAPGAFVTFGSGELGGGRILEDITVSQDQPNQPCATPSSTVASLATEFDGLRIGMSAQDIQALVPSPVVWRGDIGRVSYRVKVANAVEIVVLNVKLSSGKVVQFSVNRNEQN